VWLLTVQICTSNFLFVNQTKYGAMSYFKVQRKVSKYIFIPALILFKDVATDNGSPFTHFILSQSFNMFESFLFSWTINSIAPDFYYLNLWHRVLCSLFFLCLHWKVYVNLKLQEWHWHYISLFFTWIFYIIIWKFGP